jgi:diguanylate cyclase (GGDEF)-like protein
VIARQDGKQSEATQRLQRPPESNSLIGWREDPRGDLWLCSPVVKDELWLVHRVGRSELYWVAVRKSAGTWLMILLFSALSLVTWRLQGALKEVIRMTHIDPLTQALNRRGFYEQSVNTFAVGKRENLLAAMMIMDIDLFKQVNDTYGHATGDNVLKQLGGYVLKASRPYDLVCRWGGEEFVLLMLVKDGAEAAVVAERMRQEAQRTHIRPGDVPVTLSGGLVLMRPDEALDEAVRRADELLYQAKQGGRNRIVQDLQR